MPARALAEREAVEDDLGSRGTRGHPGEQYGGACLGRDGARAWRRSVRVSQRDETGEPRGPGGVHADPRRGPRELVRPHEVILPDRNRGAACAQQRIDDRGPVVGLVIEDPGGDARARWLPWPHEVAPMRPTRAGRFFCGLARPLPRVDKRRVRLRLHDVHDRLPREPSEHNRFMETLRDGRRERTASHLHHEGVERDLGVGELVGEGATAVDGEAVVGTLTREWDRTRGHRLAKAMDARIARRVSGFPRADVELCSEITQPRRAHSPLPTSGRRPTAAGPRHARSLPRRGRRCHSSRSPRDVTSRCRPPPARSRGP